MKDYTKNWIGVDENYYKYDKFFDTRQEFSKLELEHKFVSISKYIL